MSSPGGASSHQVRRALAALALAAGATGLPSIAGQASTTFEVSITVVPGPASCSSGVSAGLPQIQCGPADSPATGSRGGLAAAASVLGSRADSRGSSLGYRLPDTRMKVAGALVDVGEASFYAWGEYSSRFIRADGIEYLEMTVTW